MGTRTLIVEDEGLMRDLLRSSLDQCSELDVVGCAADGPSGVNMANDLKAEVVLMDIELGSEPNGIEAGRSIRESNPTAGIVLLSSHKDRQYLDAVPLAEAQGWSYLTKQSISNLNVLTRAIEGAAAGLNVVDPVIVQSLRPRSSSILASLSPRQLETLKLIAEGYSDTGIAQQLVLREKSVENYINTLYQQLQITRNDPIHRRVTATLIYLRESVPA